MNTFRGPHGVEYTASASEDTPSLQSVGQFPIELEEAFRKEVPMVLNKVGKNRAKSQQKNPNFILSSLQDAIARVMNPEDAAKSIEKVPRGGLTDVGLRAGGRIQRHTTWPLVCALMHVRRFMLCACVYVLYTDANVCHAMLFCMHMCGYL
jgi:hypothetical protein